MDTRLVGETAENIFLSLLNEQGIFAVSFDTTSFDGIIFDTGNVLFKTGQSPFFVQIKCRGSKNSGYNPQGHSLSTINKIRLTGETLTIPETSIYFVVGFYLNSDIREIVFFGMPLPSLKAFLTATQYRFSVSKCKEVMREDNRILQV